MGSRTWFIVVAACLVAPAGAGAVGFDDPRSRDAASRSVRSGSRSPAAAPRRCAATAHQVRIVLRGLPRGRVDVRMVIRGADGRLRVVRRSFLACTARR